jgi:hypothetical protein
VHNEQNHGETRLALCFLQQHAYVRQWKIKKSVTPPHITSRITVAAFTTRKSLSPSDATPFAYNHDASGKVGLYSERRSENPFRLKMSTFEAK